MATQTKKAKQMEGYVFRAQAVAAHFRFTNGHAPFGDEFTLTVSTPEPGRHEKHTGARSGPEISFTDSSVSIVCEKASGVYTTTVRSSLTGFNVNDILTADLLEAGLVTVYREEWYQDPSKPKHARVLPLLPVIKNLKIHGAPIRPGQDVQLPQPFAFNDAKRQKYFQGEGAEILPPGQRIPTAKGEIQISVDAHRISVPNFGIVYIADWTSWQPPKDKYRQAEQAHWVQLIRLHLSNPGSGGSLGLGGDGTSYP